MSAAESSTRGGGSPAEALAVDFDAFYRVEGWDGIAWTLRGHPTEQPECQGHPAIDCGEAGEHSGIGDVLYCDGTCEQPVPDLDRVRAVMVGDDREFEFDVDELHQIDEDEFCHGCGQIGCGHG